MFDTVRVTSSLNMFWNAMRIQDLRNCTRIVIQLITIIYFGMHRHFPFLIVCTCPQALFAQRVEVSKQLQWSCSNVVLCHSCSKAWETRMSCKSICESDFSQSWRVQLGSHWYRNTLTFCQRSAIYKPSGLKMSKILKLKSIAVVLCNVMCVWNSFEFLWICNEMLQDSVFFLAYVHPHPVRSLL